MAGGFFPPRRAVPVEGGYRLSGRCTFNSNCHAATWILGLAHVYDDGVERLDENGEPVTLMTLFPREKAEIIDNWDTLGMRGTGSHDVNVDDVFVPAERAVPFKPLEQPSPAYSGPWHRLTIWPSVAGAAHSGARHRAGSDRRVRRTGDEEDSIVYDHDAEGPLDRAASLRPRRSRRSNPHEPICTRPSTPPGKAPWTGGPSTWPARRACSSRRATCRSRRPRPST